MNEPTIADVLSAPLPDRRRPELVFVKPEERLGVAIAQMLLNDFSQVPVIRKAEGASSLQAKMLTWPSVAQALLEGRVPEETSVGQLQLQPIATLKDQVKFRTAVREVLRHDAVLVCDAQGMAYAILTAHDLLKRYHLLAEHLLLLESVEKSLRQLLVASASAAGTGELNATKAQEWTMAELIKGIAANWAAMRLSIDRGRFMEKLEEIRLFRNDALHFKDNVDFQPKVEMLRAFCRFLERLPSQPSPRGPEGAQGQDLSE